MVKLKLVKKPPVSKQDDNAPRWRILVADDDASVHTVTRMALRNLTYQGRGVEILSAQNATEARALLAEHTDIAIVLLEVVMDSDDAGLKLVRHIREVLGNNHIRIILRTDQAGQAPEEEVIVKYDINDCKTKTEITTQKLFFSTITALRTWDHLRALDMHRKGLQRIIETSDSLHQEHSLQLFSSGVLTQLGSMMSVGDNGMLLVQYDKSRSDEDNRIIVLAASESCWTVASCDWESLPVTSEVREMILNTFDTQGNSYGASHTTLYFGHEDCEEPSQVAYLHCPMPDEETRNLVELFCNKITSNFRKLYLYEQLWESKTQLERELEDTTRALGNARWRLTRLATTDALTGVPNHLYFSEQLEREIARQSRCGGVFCVAIFEIDDFEYIATRYGETVSDRILQMVAERLRQSIRAVDLPGRISGARFSILFVDSRLKEARNLINRLRVAVLKHSLGPVGKKLTIRAGVVQAQPGETATALLMRASDALSVNC